MRPLVLFAFLVVASPALAGPLYGTLATVREDLERVKDRATATCARSQTDSVPRAVTVTIRAAATTWPHRGDIRIAAVRDDVFSTCFATVLEAHKGTYGEVPRALAGSITLTLSPPAQILSRVITRELDEFNTCWPRPGEVPRTVDIDVFTDDGTVATRATTKPSNPGIDVCIADHLSYALQHALIGEGPWKPEAHVTKTLAPKITNASLRAQVDDLAREAAATCLDPEVEAIHARMRVTVVAVRDADDFRIFMHSGNERRDMCAVQELAASLRAYFEHDGYFRIDGHAKVSLTFAIQTFEQLVPRRLAREAREWHGYDRYN